MGTISIWKNSFRAQIRLRMHLRASKTFWLLGAPDPRRNGSVPQANSPAHQERVEKVNDFLKTGRISIWKNLFRAQIRLRMHLRASRTLWLVGALSGPQTPAAMAVHTAKQPCTPKEGKKMVNCFLKTERISSSGINHLGLR